MKTPGFILILLTAAATAGCRSTPTFSPGGPDARVRTFSATLHVNLDLHSNAPVELDGIMVAELPRSFRLQLWKISQPVLDITRTRRGTWLLSRLAEEGVGDSEAVRPDSFQNGALLIAAGLRLGRPLGERASDGPTCSHNKTPAGEVECCVTATGSAKISCTLSRKRILIASAAFDDFRRVGTVDWPMDVRLTVDSGELHLVFDQIEINEPLGPDAFRIPARARKIQ